MTSTPIPMAENKFYLTKEGLEKIKKDYNSLLEFRKMKTTGEVPSIWHSEDVNPEYLSFQEDMSVLEARLTEYENTLKNVELITLPHKEKRQEICLGATVVCEVEGDKDEFTIIGSLEANPSLGNISNESPVGKALLGHRVGDTVTVHSSVAVSYKILRVSY